MLEILASTSSNPGTMALLVSFIVTTIALASPLVLAAMGGFTSERTGVVNIGLEGMMLASAFFGTSIGFAYGPFAGLLAGILAATALSCLHWLATQIYRVDHVISGIAINALAAGGTSFLYERFRENLPGGRVPSFPVEMYYGIAIFAPLALWAFVRMTRGGLRLLAVGSDPDKARLMGIQPLWVRLWGLVATGFFTGIAGVLLITYTGGFTDNMTAGRGYIALAALILGGWRPVPTLVSCVAFGFFSALRIQLEGVPWLPVQIPSGVWATLPYVVTVIALAGFLGRNRTPAGLGKP